ncbi:MAG: endolytic transglycosylase MltG [Chloroflexi bacterium]|nr:endolytic transglycosylase MltG [Chloroflexota bacterium]
MRRPEPRAVALWALFAWVLAVAAIVAASVDRASGHTARAVTGDGAPTPLLPSREVIEVIVESGASAQQITATLVRRGVLEDPSRFATLLALSGAGAQLQAGRYELRARTPTTEVLRRLRLGLTAELLVTVPEGLRLEEVGAIFAERRVFTTAQWAAALAAPRDEPFLRGRPAGATLNGYLLPASYPVGAGATAEEMVTAMLEHFGNEVTPSLIAEAEGRGLTLHQVLTLAAIVEREAAVPREQPLVAAVFLNRLREGIPLQADPTVQFAVADPSNVSRFGWWKRDLTERDLEVDSPYNTYRRRGLPPAPIANPGIAAIRAVIRAPRTPHLYFVAAPECDGSHRFATTLAEHEANIRAFVASRCGG